MSGQRNFCLGKSQFLEVVRKLEKYILQIDDDLAVGQHDQWVEHLVSQDTILAWYCLLSGHFFEPWNQDWITGLAEL